jgi:hypothetical protein
MERIGARGRVSLGGRFSVDAKGLPATAMAKRLSGDWRNPDRFRAWTRELARALPHARPGPATFVLRRRTVKGLAETRISEVCHAGSSSASWRVSST